MSAELSVVRRLQTMILPAEQELSGVADLDIAGFMEPADEVGGDYYEVLQSNGRVVFGIGDVTGHGLESSMLMLVVQMAVRTRLAHKHYRSGKSAQERFYEVIKQNQQRGVEEIRQAVVDNVQCDDITLLILNKK